jgi:membrane-associated phospholipid phosphatase
MESGKNGLMKFFKSNMVISLLIGMGILFLFIFYLDEVVMFWVRDFHRSRFPGRPLFDIVNRGIEIMGQGSTLTIVILVCYGIGKFFNKKLYEVAKYSLAGFITSGLIVGILKHLIGRGRPRLTTQLDHLNPLIFIGPTMQKKYNALPSGHAAAAFCIAYILSKFFPRYQVIFYLLAVSVGLHRMEELAHVPSDILAGAFVGLLVGRLITSETFNQYKDKVLFKFQSRIRSEKIKPKQG